MKKIVFFGATGQTGVYICEYLLQTFDSREYELVMVGRRDRPFDVFFATPYIKMNIIDPSAFEQLPQKDVYAVIFFAGILPAHMEGYHPTDYIDTNIRGMLNVLEYCRKINAEKLIYSQTIRDIGMYMGKELLKADMKRNYSYTGDHAVYIISKNAAVDLIEHYCQSYGLKKYILRLPTIYAYTKDDHYYVDGIKHKMGYRRLIEQASRGEDIEVWGNPQKAHDIVYVKDLAQIVYKAVIDQENGGIYNVGTGHPISLIEQIEGIISVFSPPNRRSKIKFCPDKTGARDYRIDISKTIKELKYHPQYSYIDYLKDFKLEMELQRFDAMF